MNYTLRIAAGKTEPINCAKADYFAVVLTGVDIQIAVPGHEFNLYSQGDSEEMPPGQTFSRLEVRNPTASDIVVVIYAGLGRYVQRRQAIVDAPSEVVNRAESLGAGATLVLAGTPTGNQIRRRYVLVSNPDTARDLKILDASDKVIATVFFRTSCILNVSGTVKVNNPDNGAAITASVAECFWTAVT